MKKSVILMGKGILAIRICDWFLQSSVYSLKYVVPVIPEPTWTDSLSKWANIHKIPTVHSGVYTDIPAVQEEDWTIELVFSVFYEKIIPQWFVNKCKRILNIHNGPLPRYRGVSPINWALKNNENFHGVTIHEITSGIDDGPIISQLLYSIYPTFDEVEDVYARSLAYGFVLFQETMPLLDKIIPYEQNHKKALYYSKRQNNLLEERRYFTKKELKKR